MSTHPPPRPSDPPPVRAGPVDRRRAALISSAVAVPVALLLAFALTSGRSGDSSGPPASPSAGEAPPLTIAALPPNPGADAGCLKVIAQLPVDLGPLAPRRVFSSSTSIVAWGDPAVILECGVSRPAGLSPGSAAQVFDAGTGPGRSAQWLPARSGPTTVWTTIDRAVYVAVSIPGSRQAADVLPPLAAAVARALPAVCQAYPAAPPSVFDEALRDSLCVYRK